MVLDGLLIHLLTFLEDVLLSVPGNPPILSIVPSSIPESSYSVHLAISMDSPLIPIYAYKN